MADRQITSVEQADLVLKAQDFTKDKDLKAVFKGADTKVHSKPKTIGVMREYMMWFFAFGLIGLGMQITWQTIRQAGGKAAFIGVVVGEQRQSCLSLRSGCLLREIFNRRFKMAEEKATKEEQKQMEDRALSVFASEKKEDMTALIISFVLAVMVLIAFK